MFPHAAADGALVVASAGALVVASAGPLVVAAEGALSGPCGTQNASITSIYTILWTDFLSLKLAGARQQMKVFTRAQKPG